MVGARATSTKARRRSDAAPGLLWHAAWAFAVAATTGGLAIQGMLPPGPELLALAAGGLAAMLGALLSLMGRPGQMASVLIWGAAGAAACHLTGGTAGPLAAWCLAPAAAATAFRTRDTLALGAAASLAAAAVSALDAILLPLPTAAPALAPWLGLLSLGTVALGFAVGLVGFQGAAQRDVRRRERAEEVLALLDGQPMLLALVERSGRVLHAAGAAIAGQTPDHLATRSLGHLVADEDLPLLATALHTAARDGKASVYVIPADDGEGSLEITLRVAGPDRLVAAVRDAHDQALRERRLEAERVTAEQQNAGKSRFLANMSHELRTPLNSTLILAKLLSDNKPGNLSAEQVKYAQTIYAAGNDLLALINDILDLSKIEAGQAIVSVETVRLSKALQTLIDPLRPLAQEKGLKLTATVAPDAPATLDTDPQRLGQVLKNLLSNALKFTEKGSVALHVSRNPNDTLSFAVKDTGIGIPAHQQELIFEAFRQADGSTHRKYGGTGLGLSISRDLAQLLGGAIHVHSTPGEGSVFTLVLPQKLVPSSPEAESAMPLAAPAPAHATAPVVAPAASAPALPPVAAPTAPAAPRRASARSILVIEDDVRFAQILSDLAGEMDFDCHLAHNAADGLAYAVHSLPSAIVLDVNLPDFSGLGVLDQLKRNPATRHIPVHVVSVADYSQEALGRGAVGYALKPVKRDELVHALQRLEAKFTQNLRRVLVVEDDERQRESVRHLLTNDDVEIVGAGTAAEALAHLRGSTFDCMVMDLNLPDLSGYELLQQMTEQDGVSFPPVIVYTGRALSRDEEQQLRRFSKSIIIKDARSPERLLDEVTLFLHQVESELSAEHRQMLQVARNRETALEGRNVLVVEDDVRNVFALSSILEPTGIRVEIARNGLEALQALERAGSGGHPAIDLVLMDIMMPEMDGYTAMREIRNRPEWRRLPIIALTAKAMKDDQEKCLAAGANDYIAKPLDVEKLLSLVRVWMPK